MRYDAIIIGAGPAGLSCAKYLAAHKKKVLIVDKDPLGGTCLNYGCMPTKFRLKFSGDPEFLYKQRRMVDSLNLAIEKSLVKRGIDVVYGRACLSDQHTVLIDGQRFEGEYIVLAVGSRPRSIPGISVDNNRVFFAEQLLWQLPENINKMQIIGAGAIGIEFAFMYSSVAKKIIVCDVADEILPREDRDIASRLRVFMRKAGVEFRLGGPCTVDSDADLVLIAIGREADREALDELLNGVQVVCGDTGFIQTDEFLRTSVSNIFAIGECIGRAFYANTASFEGRVAAQNILGQMQPLSYPAVPRVVFSSPPVASVGVASDDLFYGMVNYPHGEMFYIYPLSGRLKIGVDKNDRIRFASMIGPNAQELIPLFTLAIEKSVSYEELRQMLYVHPTLAEAVARVRFE